MDAATCTSSPRLAGTGPRLSEDPDAMVKGHSPTCSFTLKSQDKQQQFTGRRLQPRRPPQRRGVGTRGSWLQPPTVAPTSAGTGQQQHSDMQPMSTSCTSASTAPSPSSGKATTSHLKGWREGILSLQFQPISMDGIHKDQDDDQEPDDLSATHGRQWIRGGGTGRMLGRVQTSWSSFCQLFRSSRDGTVIGGGRRASR